MAPSIGLNLRVTGYCNQGGRKYMEDVFSVAYQQTEDEKDLEYAYFGIFDGHGGREAAVFAKEHLMDHIVRQKGFWSDDDELILKAIHEGFIQTHHTMWKELDKWPRTASGLPSTAGTTASIAFIRRGKIYIGHVGDSAIVLGVQDPNDPNKWESQCLTRDHKPESSEETQRIQKCGGKVVSKSGVHRVVWNRPKIGHKGPVRRSTHIDEIPFLAVARSLGDLWSYNSEEDAFVVSPEPDTYVYPIDINKHRCLILGTDGCWNMLSPQQAVQYVCCVEKSNEQHMLNPSGGHQWINPSKNLVDKAIERWTSNNLRADNTSVVTVMLDPPGPPRAQVLKKQREELSSSLNAERGSMALVTNREQPPNPPALSIISRFPNAANLKERNLAESSSATAASANSKVLNDLTSSKSSQVCRLSTSSKVLNKNSDSVSQGEPSNTTSTVSINRDEIQCNEVSSSEGDELTRRKPETPRLSRELSALQIEGDSHNRGRTRSASDSNSDTENEAPGGVQRKKTLRERLARKKMELTEDAVVIQQKLLKNPRFLRSKEAKVKKSASMAFHAAGCSSAASPTTVMSLRPRSSHLVTPEGSRKRKQESVLEKSTKSPRMATAAVVSSKPVMTRSRTARVLHLKKS